MWLCTHESMTRWLLLIFVASLHAVWESLSASTVIKYTVSNHTVAPIKALSHCYCFKWFSTLFWSIIILPLLCVRVFWLPSHFVCTFYGWVKIIAIKKNKRALFIINSSLICNKISIPSTIVESNGHGIRFERTVNIVVYERRWFDKFHLILAPNVNGKQCNETRNLIRVLSYGETIRTFKFYCSRLLYHNMQRIFVQNNLLRYIYIVKRSDTRFQLHKTITMCVCMMNRRFASNSKPIYYSFTLI